MLRLRRSYLYAACILLAISFVAAEEWAGGATGLTGQRATLNLSTEAPPAASSAPHDGNHARFVEPYTAHHTSTPHTTKIYRICRVTAYCDRGTTAAGVPSGVGQCAAPADIPLGSIVYVPTLDETFIVTDRTHRRFRHNTLDLFIPSKKRCRQFGRSYLECEFTFPDPPLACGKALVPAGNHQPNQLPSPSSQTSTGPA